MSDEKGGTATGTVQVTITAPSSSPTAVSAADDEAVQPPRRVKAAAKAGDAPPVIDLAAAFTGLDGGWAATAPAWHADFVQPREAGPNDGLVVTLTKAA